eukprot:148065_1
MAKYYCALDLKVLHDNITAAGNAAHQVRNFMTGKNNAETPELLIVDQLSAQVEAATRDMLSLIKHNIDIQKQLTNCIRCTNTAQRTLSNNMPSYVLNKINEQEFSLVVQYLKCMETLLTQNAKMIVCALTKEMISNFQLNLKIIDENSIDIIETHGCIQNDIKNDNDEGDENDMKIERNRNINDPAFVIVDNKNIEINFKNVILNIDKYTLQNPCVNMNEYLNIINIISRNGCNCSHQIQNCAAPFTRTNPGNDIAKQIINIAGQMENQWRNIQMQLYNFKRQYKIHANVDHLKRNLCNNTKKQIDAIKINLDKISKMRNAVIKLDQIDALEGSQQVLIAVFTSNFKLQFGL